MLVNKEIHHLVLPAHEPLVGSCADWANVTDQHKPEPPLNKDPNGLFSLSLQSEHAR